MNTFCEISSLRFILYLSYRILWLKTVNFGVAMRVVQDHDCLRDETKVPALETTSHESIPPHQPGVNGLFSTPTLTVLYHQTRYVKLRINRKPPWRQHPGKWHFPNVDTPLECHLNHLAFLDGVHFSPKISWDPGVWSHPDLQPRIGR